MKIYFLSFLLALNLLAPLAAKEPKILEWDQLMPPGYVESLLESAEMEKNQSQDFFGWDDNSLEAQSAYEELKIKLSSAPIVPELNNEFVRLAGFIVPLDFDFDEGTFKEFLLVPYYGACIHVPPPPSNQIVHATTDKPLEEEWLNYAVWMDGVLTTESVYSEYGFAGYSMSGVKLTEYEE